MTADVSILSGGCRREHDAIWARALEEELLAFTPKHTYVACSRLLTRLRSMRRLLPISIDACVLVPYWCAIWEVVVSNLRSHEADRPETCTFETVTSSTSGQNEHLRESMLPLIHTQGLSRDGGYHLTGRQDHTVAFTSVLHLSQMPCERCVCGPNAQSRIHRQ